MGFDVSIDWVRCRSRYAYVTMATVGEARRALEAVRGTVFQQRTVFPFMKAEVSRAGQSKYRLGLASLTRSHCFLLCLCVSFVVGRTESPDGERPGPLWCHVAGIDQHERAWGRCGVGIVRGGGLCCLFGYWLGLFFPFRRTNFHVSHSPFNSRQTCWWDSGRPSCSSSTTGTRIDCCSSRGSLFVEIEYVARQHYWICPIYCLLHALNDRLIDVLSMYRSLDWLIDSSINRMLIRLIDWLIDWFISINQSINQYAVYWLVDWLM